MKVGAAALGHAFMGLGLAVGLGPLLGCEWSEIAAPVLLGMLGVLGLYGVVRTPRGDLPWAALVCGLAHPGNLTGTLPLDSNLGTLVGTVVAVVIANLWAGRTGRPTGAEGRPSHDRRSRPRARSRAMRAWTRCASVAALLMISEVSPHTASADTPVRTVVGSDAAAPTRDADDVPAEPESAPTGDQEASPETQRFGGPSSVPGQVRADEEAPRTETARRLGDWLDESFGLQVGVDYSIMAQQLSESLGEDAAAGGVFRLYGQWTPSHRGEPIAGGLVYKLEERHRIGTDIAPQALGPVAGYQGLTALTFSDAGLLLTNLYWHQSFLDSRVAFAAGIVDTTDYVDVYGLVNPWTEFSNVAFTTNPAIAFPDQSFGVAVRLSITPHLYTLFGIADPDGDPEHPGDTFRNFFARSTQFRHLEIGWAGSWDERFVDNVHVMVWQVDRREEAGVDAGWGIVGSFSHVFADRWLPFLRAGYSDGGGALLRALVSAGLGYRLNDREDYIGIGASWGRPPTDVTGGTIEDQGAFEIYYRAQIFPHLTLTPDFQLLLNPARNPSVDTIWVVGLRLRVAF